MSCLQCVVALVLTVVQIPLAEPQPSTIPTLPEYDLKIRVDDEVAVYQNGEAVIDTFPIEGSQFKTVYDAKLTTSLLVIKVHNMRGRQGILATINGHPIPNEQWRCASLSGADSNPDEAYPGVFTFEFDDSEWLNVQYVQNEWGNTDGFDNSQKWVWGTSLTMVCRVRVGCSKERDLKIRVDDDLAVYQNGESVLDTYVIPGPQWNQVYDVKLTSNLLVVTGNNIGGPGGILATIDGKAIELSKWRCNTLSSVGQNPEEAYPGSLSEGFDDSSWSPAEVIPHDYGSTNGFADSVKWVWGGPQSNLNVICRLQMHGDCPAFQEKKCLKRLAKKWAASENGVPVEKPVITNGCRFERKQCNEDKCFCVKPKSGYRVYCPLEVPKGESYDCSRPPKKCQRKRFSRILKNESGFIPECAESGHYVTKQCHSGECWCVKPKSGKERRKTRTTSSLQC